MQMKVHLVKSLHSYKLHAKWGFCAIQNMHQHLFQLATMNLSSQGACQCSSLTVLAAAGSRFPLHQTEEALNTLKEAQV